MLIIEVEKKCRSRLKSRRVFYFRAFSHSPKPQGRGLRAIGFGGGWVHPEGFQAHLEGL